MGSIGLCLVAAAVMAVRTKSASQIAAVAKGTLEWRFNVHDVAAIKALIPESPSEGYFITAEYMMGPFMSQSHVVAEWLLSKKSDIRSNIIKNASFIVLPTSFDRLDALKSEMPNFTEVYRGPSLVCFKPDI